MSTYSMFGLAPSARIHGGDEILEAARLAGSDVEDASDLRGFQHPAHHRDGIVDIDEIAALLAVADAGAMRLEQLDRLAGLCVVEFLGDEAHHRALVVLVRAEHVEELAARPLRRHLLFARDTLGEREIEQMLAPTVEIHRLEALERRDRPVIGEPLTAVAVGRRRGRIDERRARLGAPVEQAQRQPEIVVHHGVAVGDGGVGDGAEVDHRVELAPVEPAEQVGRADHVGNLALLQVAPLAVRAEPVVHGDVGAAGLVEARDDVRSDESRPAGHQNHQRIPRDPTSCLRAPGPPLPHSARGCNLGKKPW